MNSKPSAIPAPERLIPAAHRTFGPLSFALLAVGLGVVAGFGAFLLLMLIALVHNLIFLGRLSVHYDTSQHTPVGPWGSAVVLGPVVGALAVVFLVKNFAPEAKGHGVPEVMDAIYYGKSVIRPVVGAIKSVASAISIGSGGSVGREGPIVQIGAAFASWLGGFAGVSRWQRATLVAAGGGAGIAATFNTPIGGVLFAVEVLMHEVSVRTLVPVALSTATATYVGQRLFGNEPAFHVPPIHALTSAAVLPAYVVLGGLMAFVAVAFIRTLYATEDLFERTIPRHDYLRHAAGMLGIGVLIEVVMKLRGHYYVEGVGYATIADILEGNLTSVGFLLALCVLKLAMTSVTLGSGGSGGIFSPCLFMGATLGGAFGLALRALFPGIPFHPAAFALAGMAGLVASTTGAALTAIVMTFEMTLDYSVVLPMTLTVAVAHGLRRMLLPQNIYTMKLARRGHYMPEALQANAHLMHHIAEMKMSTAATVAPDVPSDSLTDRTAAAPAYLVLVDGPAIVGVVEREAVASHAAAPPSHDPLALLARHDFVVVSGDTTFFALIGKMNEAHSRLAVVLAAKAHEGGAPSVSGVVTRADVAEALVEGMDIFAD